MKYVIGRILPFTVSCFAVVLLGGCGMAGSVAYVPGVDNPPPPFQAPATQPIDPGTKANDPNAPVNIVFATGVGMGAQ